ncbi:hypothetical protein [Streptomyces sp. NPDC006879]|uniref:hypothetical protein n=1 Tax=Streptomyces sp. NPDC006879 TaxID=3364767 RepID=UPI0036BA30B6
MPENATPTTVASQYIAQVAEDLARNVHEQERIGAEISSLQDQLVALQHDHTVLENMQQALGVKGTTAEATDPAGASENAALPSPRQSANAQQGKARRTPRTAATAATDKKAKTVAEPDAPAKTSRPTLVELIRHHLTSQNEPRSAAEISLALDQAHPERGVKTKVVRITLESLVARNRAQRTKQGSSVFYTAADQSGPSAGASQAEKSPEGACR